MAAGQRFAFVIAAPSGYVLLGLCYFSAMSVEMENCVIVRAYGRVLDQLREEASRVSRGYKADWSIERGDKGVRFCFENAEAKKAFASICENLAISYTEA
ncbi:hypothetical protein Q3C01_08320 [Bradyrhizobium sp. UFLA05-109]